jgi:hypothetical protein
MSNTYSDHFSMPGGEDMPPLPRVGEVGPHVCSIIQLYLGVFDDLADGQKEIMREHVRTCADCAAIEQLMQSTTNIFGGLSSSMPSSRVDEAVMEAIAARGEGRGYVGPMGVGDVGVLAYSGREDSRKSGEGDAAFIIPRGRRKRPHPTSTPPPPLREFPKGPRRVVLGWGVVASAAMAAVVLLSFLAMMHFVPGFGPGPQAYSLPATLSWNSYVIYHSETRIDAHGERYRVNTYYDPGSGRFHVETVMPGSMDVVAVGDGHDTLGMDMMHHVAQWETKGWSSDESMFDLPAIRSDLKMSLAAFMDKDMFRGQAVYRIRCSNGLVLLLNMQYVPVNVLRGAVGPGTGEPLYDTLVMMPSSHVSGDMWDMRVPNGFHMGELPDRP